MNLSNITIVFTFYCEGDVSWKYLQLCLQSVFGEKILVPESIDDIHVLHVGYYSMEVDVVSSADVREEADDIDGVCSTLNFLQKFGDIKRLDRFVFTPDKKMSLEWSAEGWVLYLEEMDKKDKNIASLHTRIILDMGSA